MTEGLSHAGTNNVKPSFSVIIPTYNSERFIANALLSVFEQTYKNYELIVSDDGSADNTVKMIENISMKFPEIKIKILRNKHRGPGSARNRGIEAAGNEWIAFLDSDDVWIKEKLEKIAEFILNYPQVNLICHNQKWVGNGRETVLNLAASFNRDINPLLSLYRKNALSPSGVTVKKALLLKAGMFDETLPSAQDYDLWLRLSMLPDIKIEYINDIMSIYVERSDNISSNIGLRLECMLMIGSRYYDNLRQVSYFPIVEKLKYKGRCYSKAGIDYIRKGNMRDGIFYLAVGTAMWPFRKDWVQKIIKKYLRSD